MGIEFTDEPAGAISRAEFRRYYFLTDGTLTAPFDWGIAFPANEYDYKLAINQWLDADTLESGAVPMGSRRWHYRSTLGSHQFCNDSNTPQSLGGIIQASSASAAAVVNTTAHTTVTDTIQTIGGGHMNAAGDKMMTFQLNGIYSCIGTPTLRIRAYFGGVWEIADFTITCVSGAVNRAWQVTGTVGCTIGGAAGSLRSYARFFDGATDALYRQAATTHNLGLSHDVKCTLTWGTANAGNTATVEQWYWKSEN